MKKSISIITWVNRILMISFIILIAACFAEKYFAGYTMYIAFILGFFQVITSLVSLFFIKRINKYNANKIIIYQLSVFSFFTILYVCDKLKINFDEQLTLFLIVSIPVVLAILWSFILESIKKEI